MTRARPALLACALALLCAGCQSMQVDELIQTRDPTKAKQGQQVEDALDRAAMEAATASGQPELGRLRLMERAYRRDPENVELATAYAAALRQAGFANRAAIVLGPFAGRPDASPEVRTEFAAVQLELGQYRQAEEGAAAVARAAGADGAASAPRAYHLLGLALEAQGRHAEAERAFRQALEAWEGDPAPVLNNLALNLAAQGRTAEARDVLLEARAGGPAPRPEVERNLRIVETLLEAEGR
jgi:Flp pilus assembly protein TadD